MMLDKKVIVVTGGTGLLGQEFVQAIVNNGGIPIIVDINKNNKIDFIKMDITNKKSIQNAINIIHEKYGKIDALVNCAYPRNKNYGRSFFDIELDDFNENINLHLGGYFLCSQQFAEYFINQGFGNIINISSIYGVIAPKFEFYNNTNMIGVPVEYAAIKSALIHLTKYMSKYFKGLNIRVNTISCGGIYDNQPEIFLNKYNEACLNKGMLDKKDLTGTLLYLLSEMSEFVNGQNIIVDDGFTL